MIVAFCININIICIFQTTDWTVHSSVMLKDTIIMAGFPPQYTAQQIQDKLPDNIRKGITKVSTISFHCIANDF